MSYVEQLQKEFFFECIQGHFTTRGITITATPEGLVRFVGQGWTATFKSYPDTEGMTVESEGGDLPLLPSQYARPHRLPKVFDFWNERQSRLETV